LKASFECGIWKLVISGCPTETRGCAGRGADDLFLVAERDKEVAPPAAAAAFPVPVFGLKRTFLS